MDECRLCKSLYPEQPAFTECIGHIQVYCKALQKPRIAVHHGIWRDLIMHIEKQSPEGNMDGSHGLILTQHTRVTCLVCIAAGLSIALPLARISFIAYTYEHIHRHTQTYTDIHRYSHARTHSHIHTCEMPCMYCSGSLNWSSVGLHVNVYTYAHILRNAQTSTDTRMGSSYIS